jgi:integrase
MGRRDYALLLLAIQTGLRLSELTSLQRNDVVLHSAGAYVRVIGKGRKERSTPLTKQTVVVMKAWMEELSRSCEFLFPSARSGRLSADGMQYVVNKHVTTARELCPSLRGKRVTPHVLRHYDSYGTTTSRCGSSDDRFVAWTRISRYHAGLHARKYRDETTDTRKNHNAGRSAWIL